MRRICKDCLERAIATRPITERIELLMLRCTSTLSIWSTWKNSGDTSANGCEEEQESDQHFAQQAAILLDSTEEPGDVDPSR